MTARELAARLNALPEDQKDLDVVFTTTVAVTQSIENVSIGPADFGLDVHLS